MNHNIDFSGSYDPQPANGPEPSAGVTATEPLWSRWYWRGAAMLAVLVALLGLMNGQPAFGFMGGVMLLVLAVPLKYALRLMGFVLLLLRTGSRAIDEGVRNASVNRGRR